MAIAAGEVTFNVTSCDETYHYGSIPQLYLCNDCGKAFWQNVSQGRHLDSGCPHC